MFSVSTDEHGKSKINFNNPFSGTDLKVSLGKNDLESLTAFNEKLDSGVPRMQAFKSTMSGCTKEAKQNAVAMAKGTMTLEEAKYVTQQFSLSAKVGQIAMKGLATAGNMVECSTQNSVSFNFIASP